MRIATPTLVTALLACCAAESWRWPEGASSVRIDTKVHFIEEGKNEHKNRKVSDKEVESDEPQFEEPTNTAGFYNRPPGVGRYPVQVKRHRARYSIDPTSVYSLRRSQAQYSDGTVDSLQYCKCFTTPECNHNANSVNACGVGKFLCCYKRPNQASQQHSSEIFNEIEDERQLLLPGGTERGGPFPPPPGIPLRDKFTPAHEAAILGAVVGPAKSKSILFGPRGPTGFIGPAPDRAGLTNPTGVYSPEQPNQGILVGPNGPTGIIGPDSSAFQDPNQGVLIGPGGPTGNIGPAPNKQDFYLPSFEAQKDETAQRGVLVGPGGPTGIIGPRNYGRRPILVGPGGPTGIIGPYGRARPPILVGPGGPTGMIGPPRRYYGK